MPAAKNPDGGVIYGVRLRDSFDYRYIGLTTKTAEIRLKQHFKAAAKGQKTPFYDWLRKHSRDEVIADVLGCAATRDELGQAEIDWIAYLRAEGQPLLNLSEGGLGGADGVVWTSEMREAARIRSTGRKGVSRYGADNPFYGKSHTSEQRAKWSGGARPGFGRGEENPNHGKFGEQHPGYGHTMPEEARRRLSEQRRGPGNPNYGKRASPETRAKMSAARKGRPMPSSRRSAHTRYHTNKGVFSEKCRYCREDRGDGPSAQ
ncbi:NUMOD3 domain-containing DNA-binding protein [Gordonia sp. (in: high G+C Gram-positive bacteria)]|uniref:NUMOD3 domain-containing DNA-binding protein n=1 Tax=Gordonia sp. (in: high G+C Gram-positive bacteria) TaxID=84139 RepID=UPI0039E6F88B